MTDLTGTLNEKELALLAKGPKFAISRPIDELGIKASFCNLAYQLRWQHHLNSNKRTEESPSTQPIPKYPQAQYINCPPCNNNDLESKLKYCYTKLKCLMTKEQRRKSENLTAAEKTIINELKHRQLVFLPSDKGSEFCVIEASKYDAAAFNHLNDGSTYRLTPNMSAKTIEVKINRVWKNICVGRGIPSYVKASYVSNNTDLPTFYHLIKTHKNGPDLKIRPIVSTVNGPSYKLSWLLSKILKPLLKSIPAHLENSLQLINDIKGMPKADVSKHPYPFSLDVVSLYTSVPVQGAIQTVRDKLKDNPTHLIPFDPDQIAELLTVILENTYFKYK